jgi:hypothetical protein
MRNEVRRAESVCASIALAARELLDHIAAGADIEKLKRDAAILRTAMEGEYAKRLAAELDTSVNLYTASYIFHEILIRVHISDDIRRAAHRWGTDKMRARCIAMNRHKRLGM